MKNFLLFLIVFFFFSLNIKAQTLLYGEAEYNVQKALNEVQSKVIYKINPIIFKPYLFDYNKNENIMALLNGKIEIKDRELALFSSGTYGVVYKKDLLHAYYYSAEGKLEYIDVRSGYNYPFKSYQYDVNGNLVNMGLRVSKRETYLYDNKSKLIAHWVGENGYDENGNIIMTRKFLE